MSSLPQEVLKYLLVVVLIFALWYLRYNQLLSAVEEDIYHKTYSPLPSGWDAPASLAYSGAMLAINEAILRQPRAVTTARVHSNKAIYFNESVINCSSSASSWGEPFKDAPLVRRLLALSTHYLGVGTGTGASLLAAAPYMDFALGVEAEPITFAHVNSNLILNREAAWSGRAYLQRAALSPGLGGAQDPLVLAMPAVSASECAPEESTTTDLSSRVWHVNAYTLTTILNHYSIPMAIDLLVDVDAAPDTVCKLVSSWADMAGYDKPTLRFTLGGNGACSADEYASIHALAIKYEYARCGDAVCALQEQEGWWMSGAKGTDQIDEKRNGQGGEGKDTTATAAPPTRTTAPTAIIFSDQPRLL